MPDIQIKRGLASALVATNPVVNSGEPIFATDTLQLKIGDGITAYSGLGVVGSGTFLQLSGGTLTGLLTAGSGNFTQSLQINNVNVSLIRNYTAVSGFPVSGATNTYYLASDSSRLYQWTGSQYVEMGPALDTISANNITLGTLPDARLSTNIPTFTALNRFLNFPSSGIDIYPRGELTNTNTAQTASQPYYSFFTPSTTVTVSAITMGTAATAGASLTLARMGLYTFDETTATLVARTANDTTLFNAAATTYTRSFDTTGGYPASYTLTAGTRYGIGVFCAGTTLPSYVMKNVNNGVGNLTPRMAAVSTSASDLPTSITMGNSNVMVFARLT